MDEKKEQGLTIVGNGGKSLNFFAKYDSNLGAFMKRVESIKTLDQAVDVLNDSALIGRELWIKTALVVNQVLTSIPKNKRAKAVDDLGGRLKYGKSQLNYFRQAGEKIKAGQKVAEAAQCNSVNEYLKLFKTATGAVSIVVDKCVGELSNTDYACYTGIRKVDGDTKTKRVIFLAWRGITGAMTEDTTEDSAAAFFATVDGKKTRVFVHYVNSLAIK